MIIQNLYNIFRSKNEEVRIKTSLFTNNKLVFSFLFSLFSFILYAQDSIVPQENITEKTSLQFQEYFFKAITEKAIKNHQLAIENLNECNRLMPNNKAVLFELSKNFLFLNQLPEAIAFGTKALNLEPNNVWILEHMVKTYRRNYNFTKAIEIQERIAKNHPKKKQQLVFLHLQNKDKNAAKKVLNELAAAKMLNARLRKIQDSLEKKPKVTASKTKVTSAVNTDLKRVFENEKSFTALQKLLTDLDTKNDINLLKYSEEGMVLFPAQPFVYLMNGKAFNNNKKYKKAIETLQNGIDFVIDDAKMETAFYTELIKAYEGLGDVKNARKFRKKIKS